MNKKFATLLFAIGLGASAGTALAFGPLDEPTCGYYCRQSYDWCIADGTDPGQCYMDRIDCDGRCGI